MKAFGAFVSSFFLTMRFFGWLGGLVVLFVLAYFYPNMTWLPELGVTLLAGWVLADVGLLYVRKGGVWASRDVAERLSNGDENPVLLSIENQYAHPIQVEILDELPLQFQERDFKIQIQLKTGASQTQTYMLRPTQRGAYAFGALRVFVQTRIGLVQRRFTFEEHKIVPVYPSYLQMQKYELYAISNRLTDVGVKQIRRVGRATNFEQIRTYVAGDEPRTMNWRATARRGDLMVNQYEEEKAQQVYSVLDLGRTMQMPFANMSLLDYAINAALVISNVAIVKQDKAGLVLFSDQMPRLIPADRKKRQMAHIQEALYRVQTAFLESNFERLYSHLHRHIPQRSLLLFYTNFETLSGMRRRLPYLQALAKRHLVVVILFENTELRELLDTRPKKTEDLYIKTIAEKVRFEKREMVNELNRHGIQTILTPPEHLTVKTINQYLALKARGVI